MSEAPSPATWSTVAALPDHLLLAQTRQLARHEQALQILVLDHLREIEARRLHLTRGYGSLFDYVVHELGYTAAAAWRRIKAMRLCSQTEGARELLQDGSLNLSNAAQLQNLFERSDRSRGRPPGSDGTGGGPGTGPRNDGATGEPAPVAPMRAGERDPAPVAGPVLDAAAREELVKQAAGKSTREVQQMLAEVDPELAQPSDRMRALAGGRWELKATIDTECRHGLEKLQMLLSHQDPHLTLGALVARLVRDGLDRYDPARPRGTRGSGGRGSVNGVRTVSKPARRETETVQESVVRAQGSDVERQGEGEQDGASSSATVRDGVPGPSAAKRPSEAEHGSASPATAPNSGGHTTSAPKRREQAEFGRTSRTAAAAGSGSAASPAKPYTEAEAGSTKSAVVRSSNGHATSPAKHLAQDEDAHIEVAERLCGAAVPAPERRRETDHACGQPKAMHGNGGRAASPANRPGRADDDGRGAAGPRFDAGERGASRAPVRSHDRFTSSAAKRLAYAAGHGAVERSPALERHLAALHSVDASPGSRSRYIPVAVRREVWRRDHGCCSYVDPHSGRRCGSRYRLEIDHVVPFALGGATELSNLRVRCRAHHRLRHAPRHAHDASVPNEARRAPISAADPVEP